MFRETFPIFSLFIKMFICVGFILVAAGVSNADFDCGIVAPQDQQLKRSVASARPGEAPWHVGIYSKSYTPHRQLCGGTLVTATAVITVAHCVWDEGSGAPKPASKYAVGVGKLRRPWFASSDTHAQTSDVSEISIPERFQGSVTNLQDDIAVLKLTSTIQFNSFVRPACLDFDLNFEKRQLVPGQLGKIASWSIATSDSTERKQLLQVLEFPYVPITQCIKEAPSNFQQFITSDKLCAFGKDSSQSLCIGASGGGLVFPEEERGMTRYYLRGVASSSAAREDNCSQFVTFTRVAQHEQFIKQHL